MNVTFRPTDTTRPPMDATRKAALVAGALYLVTFATSIPALGLYDNVLNNPDFVLGGGNDGGVPWGAFLEIILGLTGVGTALAVFPVIKRHSERAALGFVTSRLLEGVMIFVGVVSLMAAFTLRQDAAAGTDAASLVATGQSLVAVHDWTFLLGPGIMPAVNALFFAAVLYRTGLVPRAIPLIGLIGAPILLASATATLFGAYEQVSAWAMLAAVPIATWELSVGVYMLVKGFRPSPITGTGVPSSVPQRGNGLVTTVA